MILVLAPAIAFVIAIGRAETGPAKSSYSWPSSPAASSSPHRSEARDQDTPADPAAESAGRHVGSAGAPDAGRTYRPGRGRPAATRPGAGRPDSSLSGIPAWASPPPGELAPGCGHACTATCFRVRCAARIPRPVMGVAAVTNATAWRYRSGRTPPRTSRRHPEHRTAEGRVSSAASLGLRAKGSAARPPEQRRQPPTEGACHLHGPGVVGMLTPAPTRRRRRGAVRIGGHLVGRTGGVAAAVRVANAQPPGPELVRREGQQRGHPPALPAAHRCPGERTDLLIGIRGVERPPRHAAPR